MEARVPPVDCAGEAERSLPPSTTPSSLPRTLAPDQRHGLPLQSVAIEVCLSRSRARALSVSLFLSRSLSLPPSSLSLSLSRSLALSLSLYTSLYIDTSSTPSLPRSLSPPPAPSAYREQAGGASSWADWKRSGSMTTC